MKSRGLPLRIKVNSHPCAGKTFFLVHHKRGFLGMRLLDFDDFHGARRTSILLQSYNRSVALLGSAHQEPQNLTDVAYIYVVPTRERLKKNIKRRKWGGRRRQKQHDTSTWSNETHILRLRARALSKVFAKGGAQREPVFYTFEEGLRFCVDAYE